MIRARAARAPLVARFLAGIFLLAAGFAPARAEEPSYPAPTGYVVDEAGLLSDESKTHITAICKELDEKTTAQIAVAIVPSIAPLEIEDYAVTLFKKWGVGSKKEDLGVLFVVAQKERRVRFEVGYGLEGILPDGRVGGILRSAVVPHLRQDDWDAGVVGGVEAVASIIAKDRGVELASLAGVEPPDEGDDGDEGPIRLPPMLVIVLGVLAMIIILNIVAATQRSGYRGRRGRGGWGGMGYGGFGGFGGGSGSSGSSFGGFGGGSSGGGGASSGF